jgi:hypothetical protein
MTASQIRQWTHDNCPEYTEVTSGRVPIAYREIYQAIIGEEDVDEFEEGIRHARRVRGLFSAG